jgi:hypothetical protein
VTKVKIAAVAAFIAVAALPAAAQAQAFAVGASVGTPGVGLQAAAHVNQVLVLRGAIDGLSFGHDVDYSDIAYNGKAKLFTGGLFADFHPGGGVFLLSGGSYFGKRRVDLTGRPMADVEIGDEIYTPAEVGHIDGEVKLSKVQPFLGLGFDNTFVQGRTWGFRALLGVSFSKKPDVDLTAAGGTLSNDPTFLAQLQQEEANAREDAKHFRYYPVVQVGLTHRF